VAAVQERCQHLIGDDGALALLQASARSYACAWHEHYRRAHDPSRLLGESNLFRYRPVRGILVRVAADTASVALAQVVLAAVTCAAPLTVSLSPDRADWRWLAELDMVQVIAEDEASLIARLHVTDAVYDRLRALGALSTALRQTINAAGINVIDVPVLAHGRLELRYYLREQTISQTAHRYGNILKTSQET
jgi:RHH-type proline utilization regulon transcriptional repressor/proline dehydrogenase/delta 1-pyrroline-5-carboxylate dehydrogenase